MDFQEGKVDENYYMNESDKTTWDFSSEWSSSTNILGLVVFRCVLLYYRVIHSPALRLSFVYSYLDFPPLLLSGYGHPARFPPA